MAARKARKKKRRQMVLKNYNKFVKKHNVDAWPKLKKLSANPFVYKGKTVAVVVTFSKMLSETRGIFGEEIVVSNIPTGLFMEKIRVVIAGRILGQMAVKTPFGGEILLPHFKYIGAHFCKDRSCSVIIPKR